MRRLAALVLLAFATAAAAQSLPRPTGPYAVGRTGMALVDPARPETMTEAPDDRRRIMIRIWYPAVRPGGGAPAPYLDADRESALFQRSYSYVGLDRILAMRTNSFAEAPVSPRRRRYPVVIFSHGLGMVASLYSAFLENLASHGYIVVGVDSPYFSSAFRFPDGTVVTNQSRRPRDRPDMSQSDQERLIAIREEEAIVQAQDLVFVLGALARIDREEGLLHGRLDLAHAGVFGHSRGGFAAPHACALEPRFRACLNLDGYELTRLVSRGGLSQPYMHIQEIAPWEPPSTDAELAEAHQTREQATQEARDAARQWDEEFHRMRAGALVVTIAGARHMSFSDSPLTAPDRYPDIAIRPERALAIANAYILAFFDRHLKGARQPLLTRAPPYPEVSLDIYRPRRPGALTLRPQSTH